MAEFPYSARATSKFKSPPGSAVPFSFAVGDTLRVLAADDEGEWLEGETTTGSKGWFPSASIERVQEEQQVAQSAVEVPKPKQDADTTSAGVDSGPEAVEEPVIVAPAPAPAPAAAPVSASTPAPPTRQPSLPASSSNDTPASSPPEVAKKPGSLRDRIAALNAQGAGAAGPPPPLPRAKPPAFKRAPIPTSLPAAATSAPTSEQPSASVASSSSPPAVEKSGDKPAFSAEDAKESIGKGGSLKDRIAALQNMTLDAPAPPGRAPKPWKKKSVEVPVEQEEGGAEAEKPATELGEGAKEDLREGQVKDELPREEETTAQSPGAEVPQFSPASPPSASPAPEARPFVAPPVKEDDDDEVGPRMNAAQETTSPTTAAPQEDNETEEPVDEETAQRSAIAARMAGLGGQRVGMAMPALPKRAGPPKRRAATPAAAAAVASPAEEEQSPVAPSTETEDIGKQEAIVEPQGGEEEVAEVKPVEVEAVTPVGQTIDGSTPVNEPALAEAAEQEPAHDEQDSLEREVAAPVTLGGGAQSLLRSTEVQDSDDEDDFDTPALPKAESDDEFDTPALPEASSSVVQPAQALEPKVLEEEEQALLESEDVEQDHVDPVEAVHTLSPPPPGRPAMPPPPPPPAQPPRDDSDEEKVEEDEAEEPSKPDLSIDTAQVNDSPHVNDASPTPTSPATASRPAIPAIPASFAAARPTVPVKEPLVIPRSVEPEEEEDGDVVSVPTSPATAHRPAIPGIPASFAPPSPAKMQPIMPLRQPEPEEEDEEEDEQYADVQGTPQSEAVDSPMDPALPPRVAPAVPKAMPPPPPPAAAQEEEEHQPAEAGDEQEEEDDDEDEEDPEVARRAALAARMAKLGGMNMRMGMPMPPVGGMRKPATKKKSAPVEEASEPAAVEEQDEEAPAPPRRLPGFPAGAVALPGMPTRKVVDPEPEPELEPTGEAETEQEDEQEAEPMQEDHTEQVMEEPESPMAPPPLPAGRPSSMLPPRRSVPTPQATEDDQDGSSAPPPPPLPSGRPLPPPPQIASQFVEEPEVHDEPFEQVSEEAAPPAPARPQGGLPPVPSSTTYSSPPLPPTASPPSSPPSRRTSIFKSASKRESVTSLDRAPAATRTSIDSTRSVGGGAGYLGEDTAPQRTNSTSSAAGQGHPLPSLPESGSGASFAPEQLAHFSSTLGAQVFAAAHSKLNDKSAREQSGENLVLFGFSRATDPAAPRGASYGTSVLALEGTAKGKPSVLNEVDEPRAGDVIVFHDTKFKHNLSTTRVGSADRPHVAVVASWDPSKRKVKTIEVGNGGAVVEGAHRLEDLKSGKVVVWRVLPREG